MYILANDVFFKSFIAFQEHIPKFAHSFYNASIYAIWRSTRNRFIFVYTDELLQKRDEPDSLFDGYIFEGIHFEVSYWILN